MKVDAQKHLCELNWFLTKRWSVEYDNPKDFGPETIIAYYIRAANN